MPQIGNGKKKNQNNKSEGQHHFNNFFKKQNQTLLDKYDNLPNQKSFEYSNEVHNFTAVICHNKKQIEIKLFIRNEKSEWLV